MDDVVMEDAVGGPTAAAAAAETKHDDSSSSSSERVMLTTAPADPNRGDDKQPLPSSAQFLSTPSPLPPPPSQTATNVNVVTKEVSVAATVSSASSSATSSPSSTTSSSFRSDDKNQETIGINEQRSPSLKPTNLAQQKYPETSSAVTAPSSAAEGFKEEEKSSSATTSTAISAISNKKAMVMHLPDEVRRRSGRERTSTLVYIDGQPVLAQNNYSVTASSYNFHAAAPSTNSGTKDEATKTERFKEAELDFDKLDGLLEGMEDEFDTRFLSSGSTSAMEKASIRTAEAPTASSVPLVPPTATTVPRELTEVEKKRQAFELKRTQHNQAIQSKVAAKAGAKQRYFNSNLSIIQPFVNEKVYQKLSTPLEQNHQSEKEETETQTKTTLYMQPEGITADLRDYQLDGLNWMAQMHQRNCGMILGDEMGLVRICTSVYRVSSLSPHRS